MEKTNTLLKCDFSFYREKRWTVIAIGERKASVRYEILGQRYEEGKKKKKKKEQDVR